MEIPKVDYNSYLEWITQFEKLPFYGWYNNTEYKEKGTLIWKTKDNNEVEVTQVTRTAKPPSDNHIFIGLLTGYKRRTINYN